MFSGKQKATVWVIGAIVVLWLGTKIWDYSEARFCHYYPVWAWQHGTLSMQERAMPELVKLLKLGTSVDEVFGMLGPGIDGWPIDEKFKPKENEPGDFEFNVKADFNLGIHVSFYNGRVAAACIYD